MYQKIADSYDYIFPYKPAQKELVLHVDSVRKKLCDIGCSTGALVQNLSSDYESITAIDLSPEMIGRAKERDCKNISFLTDSMLNLSTCISPNEFDIITCFGNTIVHLDSESDILDLFKQIRSTLNKDGSFLGQIINYDLILDENRDSLPTIENEYIQFKRHYIFNEGYEKVTFQTELLIKLSDEVIVDSVQLLPLRKERLEELLCEAGFTNINFYSDFHCSPQNPQKLPLVFVAQK